MTPERWREAEPIYEAAARLPAAERDAFLTEQCRGDTALRLEVESLLAAMANADSFLGKPAIQVAAEDFPLEDATIVPGQSVGPYRVVSRLGAGGMGGVWRAHDPRVGRDVALKFCDPKFSQRFGREARAIAALNHPNICHLYDVGPNYLVMELVEGKPLTGPLPFETALRYARQVADALEAAHDRGIVHRDLKPGNVMMTTDGKVKVLDFGLAKFACSPQPDEDTRTIDDTQVGVILGTAAYMSPEQSRGQEIDKRADIWAFGVLLYELVTGKSPFKRASVSDSLAAVLTAEPDLTPAPGEMRRLLRRCLEKDPRKRLRDIADAWDLLDARPASHAERGPMMHWAPWIAAGLLFVVAASALWALWRSGGSAEKPPVRLEVDLGPDVSLPLNGGVSMDLSSDGTRLVYISHGQLFTRRMDELAAKRLPGTEGATSPFFSPDGQWVAFFSHGQLRKVSVDGGSPTALTTTAANFCGAAWGDDDNIVLPLTPNGSLVRLPSSGGAPQPFTELDSSHGEVTHRFPQVLPGSQSVIFTVHSSITGFDDSNIDVFTLRDHRRKPLLRSASFARYIPSGHLLYVRAGALYAVPFDVNALQLRGEPHLVLDHPMYSAVYGTAQVAFSRSGTLMYRSGQGPFGPGSIEWLDRSGRTKPFLSKPGIYLNPRVSPDGQRLVVNGPYFTLLLYEQSRDTLVALAQAAPRATRSAWTPDGRFIVYRDQEGLIWIRADGAGGTHVLLQSGNALTPGSFTADGKRLSYYETQVGGSHANDIWTLPVENDGKELRAGKPELFLQSRSDRYDPYFSADGRWLAYTSDEGGGYQVIVRSFPDGGRKWLISGEGGRHPVFARTSNDLFFLNQDDQAMVVHYTIKGDEFVAEPARLWSERRIVTFAVGFWSFDVSPDGKRVAATLLPDTPELHYAQNHVTLVENFFGELRRLAPATR